jgi:hypothetical protein
VNDLQNDLSKCESLLTLLDSTFRGATFNGLLTADLSNSLRRVMNAAQANIHRHEQTNNQMTGSKSGLS